jgi:hypothetical protein
MNIIDEIMKDVNEADSKGIFARIPKDLHDEVVKVKNLTGLSLYNIVEKSLRIFMAKYEERRNQGKTK